MPTAPLTWMQRLKRVFAIDLSVCPVAVFITLIYLAMQTRHARAETQRLISQRRAEGWCQIQLNRVNNDRCIHLTTKAHIALGGQPPPFVAAVVERAGFTDEDALVLMGDLFAEWAHQTQVIAYINEVAPATRMVTDRGLRTFCGVMPLGRLWYETTKATLNPDYVRYVDNLLTRPD